MATTQKQLLETIKSQCDKAENRFDSYRDDLLATIAEIVAIERSHHDHATNVVQRIADKCDALGDLIALERQRTGVDEE